MPGSQVRVVHQVEPIPCVVVDTRLDVGLGDGKLVLRKQPLELGVVDG